MVTIPFELPFNIRIQNGNNNQIVNLQRESLQLVCVLELNEMEQKDAK